MANFARQREDLGATAFFGTDIFEPFATVQQDSGNVGEGFYVVDNGGFSPQAFDGGERRTDAGLTTFAFNGANQGGFSPQTNAPAPDGSAGRS